VSRAADIERLYASYGDMVEFLIVYIREAHPEQLREGSDKTLRTGVIGRPITIDERIILATECVTQYKFSIPMVIDGMDQKVAEDYDARTVRTTITDKDGKVAYYADRGPFGFSIPEIERALKKIAAHNGYMPPPPEPQWGEPVNGLRCGLVLDPPNLKIGDEVLVQLSFENTTDQPVNLVFPSNEVLKNLDISGGNGQPLKIEAAGSGRSSGMMMGRMRRVRPQRIGAGEVFQIKTEGKVTAVSEEQGPAGDFGIIFNLEVNDQMLAQAQTTDVEPLWQGKLHSGKFTFGIEAPQQLSCLDCHGTFDYHHTKETDCTICHVGRVGGDDFASRTESCIQCHPRPEVQGRRLIGGPEGEFSMVSRHLPGPIKNEDCLLCHDPSRHQNGVVSLIDPDSGQTRPWIGTETGFCLTCHDGDPPGKVKFPEAKGSGYDKSAFLSTHAKGGVTCSTCHASHGSSLPSLIKIIH